MNAVKSFFHGMGDRFRALPRWAKVLLAVAAVVFVYLLPIINPPLITTTDSDFGAVLFLCALYSLVAIGLNIVIGYAGLLDLGYIGFFAIGAFTVGVLGSSHAKLPLLLCIPIAMAATLLSGVLLGAPTLRVRGDYLAIVTLGFGEIVRLILLNADVAQRRPRHLGHPLAPRLGHLRDPAHHVAGVHGLRRPGEHHHVPVSSASPTPSPTTGWP